MQEEAHQRDLSSFLSGGGGEPSQSRSYSDRIKQMVVDATSRSNGGDPPCVDTSEVHDDTPAPTPTSGDGYDAGADSPDGSSDVNNVGSGQLHGVKLEDVNSSLDTDLYFDEENGRFGMDNEQSYEGPTIDVAPNSTPAWVGTPEPVDRYESLTMDEQAVTDFNVAVKESVAAKQAAARKISYRAPRGSPHGSNDSEDSAHAVSPRDATQLDDSISSDNVSFFNRPHLAKYLFITSIFLVLCSLGLAAAGLGMMYTSKQSDDARDPQLPEGFQDFSEADLGDNEGLDILILPSLPTSTPPAEVGDGASEVDDTDLDDTGPKARVTDAPTPSVSVDVFDLLEDTVDTLDTVDTFDTTVATTTAATTGATQPGSDGTSAPASEVIEFLNDTSTNSTTTNTSTTVAPPTTTDSSTSGNLHSIAIKAIADTWLEFNDTDAYGDKKRLKVDGMDPRATLLKFNIANATDLDIVSVSLRLYSLTSSPFGGKIDKLGNFCSEWDEYNISWTNAPKCAMRDNAKMLGQFETIPAWTWNEAELALDLDGLPELITLRVTSHYADGVTYASRENATAAPELVVYYAVNLPTESPTPKVLSASPTAGPTKSPEVAPEVDLNTTEPIIEFMNDTSSNSTAPTKSPSYAPSLPYPTYVPTLSPTWNGTRPPTLSPSTTPEDLVILATQDATIRGGDFDDSPLGEDPYLTLRGPLRKTILEFDLSALRPSFEYFYTLRIFVSYVSFNEQRSITASYISEEGFSFDEQFVTWNNFGAPNTTEIGWFSIFQSDSETSVDIPLGNLPSVDDKLTLVLEIHGDTETGADTGGPGDKFDFRSREYAEWASEPEAADTAPTLLAQPQLEDCPIC